MKDTSIAWTHSTFNCWRGCTKVSAGCKLCYASTMSKRNPGVLGVWGPNGTRVVASEAMWKQPLKWEEAAKNAGERHRVFCASLADVFEGRDTMPKVAWEDVENARIRLLNLIRQTPNLDWILLTKRPENVLTMLDKAKGVKPAETDSPCDLYDWLCDWTSGRPPENVWLGTSVENQELADERIPHLLQIPAVVRFLSCEPLLGPINLERYYPIITSPPHYWGEQHPLSGWMCERGFHGRGAGQQGARISWVIIGGESGHHRRECEVDWIRSISDQVQNAGSFCFIKQDSALHPGTQGRIPDDLWSVKDFPIYAINR